MLALDRRHIALALLVVLAGCNDTRDLAPSSPTSPWQFQASDSADMRSIDRHVTTPAETRRLPISTSRRYDLPADPDLPWPEQVVAVDQSRVYSLAELIDLGERNSKETRVAWEQARQAAIDVGVARAALLPQLTADALGGYTHSALPFPTTLAPRGYITSNGEGLFPEVVLHYLLFDFGATHAAVTVARETSFAANVAFTAAHQRLILAVAKAYYELGGADAELKAARASVDSATLLRKAAESRYARGEGTVLDVALARRGTAQAALDLTQAGAVQQQAMFALVAALGYAPTTTLHVADASEQPLPATTTETVSDLMQQALKNRPDVLADLARLRAADAGVAKAHASFYPKLSISAHVNGNIGAISVDSGPQDSIAQPEGGIFLRLDWPIYEGGLLQNELRLSESKRNQAIDVLQESEERALRDVASAVNEINAGLAQYQASLALETASRTAFDQASEAYAHGVGNVTDAASAATALAQARANSARAHAQALADAAGLAFSAGELTSSQALP